MPELFKELESAGTNSTRPLADVLDALRYNEAGLVPAIAQDATTGQVLMLAWMNRAALDETLKSSRVTYYSRSRQELWRKGDTSGHVQVLKTMQIDCDGDAVLLQVEQTGAACHTYREHCFYVEVDTSNNQVVVTCDPGQPD